jgi:cation:H+ antiporter
MLILLGLGAGLFLLLFGGDWLVKGASNIAQSLGISSLVIGLTIVAMGTSMPELLVSVGAALSGSSDIAVGNIVGSNIANIGLILGISGLIYPIQVHINLVRREIPLMLIITLAALWMFQDGRVERSEGLLLIAGLVGFTLFMIVSSQREMKSNHDLPGEKAPIPPVQIDRWREILRIVAGIAMLMVGAQLTVSNATELARSLGVSEFVIGVTLIAVGTSLPELVTSVVAAIRQKSDIAIGNVVGSNIFNILAILGITSFIQPIGVSVRTINFDGLVMVGFSLLVLPFVLDRRLGRIEATFFLACYVGFTLYTVLVAP